MSQSKADILQETFLQTRAKILEIAATLDRIDRADGKPINADDRFAKLAKAMELVLAPHDGSGSRAEQIQLLFSRPYDAAWLQSFQPTPRS